MDFRTVQAINFIREYLAIIEPKDFIVIKAVIVAKYLILISLFKVIFTVEIFMLPKP